MDDAARVAVIDTPTYDPASTGEVQTLRYQYSNHLGTASLELDDAANIISYEEYYPFGNTSYQAGHIATEVSRKRYRYVGKERDDESGFYYMGARYFCPWLARWLAVDPINNEWYNQCKGVPQRNRERDFMEFTCSNYEYCYANPVRFTDPTGEQVPPKVRLGLFFFEHPIVASAIGDFEHGSTNITTNAVRFSLNTTGKIDRPGGYNGSGLKGNSSFEGSEVNAFRHTLWQATISSKFGEKVAKSAGDGHEANPNTDLSNVLNKTYGQKENKGNKTYEINQEGDQAIDLLNNIEGRQIGTENKDASMKDIALKVLEKFHKEGLFVAVSIGGGKWKIEKHKISNDEYKIAKEALLTTNNNGYTPPQQEKRDIEIQKNQQQGVDLQEKINRTMGPKI